TVTLKKLMQDAVTSGNVNILPERFSKTYFHWIDNLRDWCISRQIWFGHQVPVWYRGDETFCGIDAPDGTGWEQDPDTLDTWFSSGLWTFSTLGWPDTKTADFQAYHPTTLLETGYDILFFWVARMILMSEYFLGVHPFETVYLHGLVRDEQGRKMSKSLGNVIDPLTVSERYGADALRLALVSGSTPGNDAKLSDEKIVAMRNFTNKLWNLARYVGTQPTPDNEALATSRSPHTEGHIVKTDADRWISEKLTAVTKSVTQHMDRYELSLAAEELRDFTWGDFADWYVEVHKIEKNDVLLRSAFGTILRLWHPFMPFVTEAIHQTFRFDPSEFLMIARWPTPDTVQTEEDIPASQDRFELLKELIVAIRNTRASYRIEPAKKMSVSVFGPSERLLKENEAIFQRLARVDEIRAIPESVAPDNTIPVQAGSLQIFLHLEGVIDIAKEKRRIESELTDKTRYITSLRGRLDDPKFSSRAPEHILAQTKALLDESLTTVDRLKESLARFDR
ncbi:MAG: valyl-tRNA synthetase, partial [Patescibacteria group bacterium]|nr:valyl-tRNA synthetase [Patescibacteria group bacterium]